MGTLLDYLEWRGDISFKNLGINQVDNLIFSELTYINYSDIVPEKYSERIKLSEAAERYFKLRPRKKNMLGILPANELQDLFQKAAETERFGEAELWGYVNEVDKEQETQFSAICYSIPGGRTYVAYRGTDNSIAGWKENFNMAFMFPVPAQMKAALYLNVVAGKTEDVLHVGGHSKGGNLAEYASAEAKFAVQRRIEHVWSNDGPGFMPEFLQYKGYKAIKDRVTKLLPVSSMVGVLLDSDCETIIVKSSAFGPKQHEGVSWEVSGGSFIRAEDTSGTSKRMDETADMMVKTLTQEQRREVIDAVFAAVYASGAESLQELISESKNPRELSQFISNIDMEPELRDKFLKALMSSFRIDERISNFLLTRKKQTE